MIKRNNPGLIIAISVIFSAIIWIVALVHNEKADKNCFDSRVFQGGRGWGYDILVNDSLFIHQELVPAIAGEKGFANKNQAEMAARLIINKMKRRQLPSVTTFEMEQIISLNDAEHDQPGKSK